ncbi:MAG: type VI secretion system ATPase TssH [Acidobacteria bacterium]|nr:type VI secretion system ATPase TssH [Acidobacteriota bacterium]
MTVNMRALIGRLNDQTRSALEAAAGLCLSRTHYDVEVEHFLMKLLDQSDGDLAPILARFEVNKSRLADELTRSLDTLKTGNARTPAIGPRVVRMLTEAWTIGSIDYGAEKVRSGFAILALAKNEDLRRLMRDISREFTKIDGEALGQEFAGLVSSSSEDVADVYEKSEDSDGGPQRKPGGKTPHLDQYTIDLTAEAESGKMDPVLARDKEIRQTIDILTRRRQNNPIMVGEAGVGKTAVVEGFAQRVAAGDVPPPLRKVRVHSLDLALLQAGASVKGEFENRLKGLIAEVKSSATPIILFIDEAHTMIGAGGQAGQGDAANLLKPALARGELRTIAATTWAEYKKYFEKDAALARRFQPVKVDEPSEADCMVMLRGVVKSLEKHHGVRILNEGVSAAVTLSHRYLPDRQLPDKAVSVLDTACARVALGQSSTPAAVEDARRRLDDLEVQTRVLKRESELGVDHNEKLGELATGIDGTNAELESMHERWQRELALVEEIKDLRAALEGETVAHKDAQPDEEKLERIAKLREKSPDELRGELARLNDELETLQGEQPLIKITVDAQIVGEVISGWTGIPLGKMVRDEIQTVLALEGHLGARVVGQDHALGAISQRIRTSKASMEDPNKPIGVFMLVGPSGVGKTETALALSDLLYGGERNMITINMSEFQEAHTVSSLKGSPPGYVGYGEGGVLTEAVRRRPYSVVLLDEVEKAHPDVLELFFQVFDKGRMDDGEGREIDFKNTIIILTSNAGTDTLMSLCADPETMPSEQGLVQALKPELDKVFKPAFLGRMVIIPYFPIRDEALKLIIRLKLGKIVRRLAEIHRIALSYDDALVDAIAARCTEVESGARNVDNILTNTLLPEVSKQLLTSLAAGEKPNAIAVTIDDNGEVQYTFS